MAPLRCAGVRKKEKKRKKAEFQAKKKAEGVSLRLGTMAFAAFLL